MPRLLSAPPVVASPPLFAASIACMRPTRLGASPAPYVLARRTFTRRLLRLRFAAGSDGLSAAKPVSDHVDLRQCGLWSPPEWVPQSQGPRRSGGAFAAAGCSVGGSKERSQEEV